MSRAAPDSTTSGTVPEDDSHDVNDESKQPPDIKGCMHLSVAPVRDRRANALTFGVLLARGLAAVHKSLKLSLQMLSVRMIWLERLAKVAIGYILHSVRAFYGQETCRCSSCTWIE